jgi:transcriptional regulator with XRE-family HTH domain
MSGAELRRIRESMDLTQTQLGDRLEVTIRTVSRWEAMKRVPARTAIAVSALANGHGAASGPVEGQTRRKGAR